MVEIQLKCSFPTARKYVEQFVELGLLRETTGFQRNRRYRFDAYLSLFESPDFRPLAEPGNAEEAGLP